MYSIWLTSSEHDREIYNLIQRFADEEGQDAFIPHVTLVTQISTREIAAKILNELLKNKCSILFDKISVVVFLLIIGIAVYQDLYLIPEYIRYAGIKTVLVFFFAFYSYQIV